MTAELTAALGSLKAAGEIAKALLSLRDAALIQVKVFELQGEIIAAQSNTLAAQMAQSTLLSRVGELEKEVADLKAWGTEREKYKLAKVGLAALAYVLKEETGTPEPEHCLCPNCYEDGRKSILQRERRFPGDAQILTCLRCGSEINMTGQSLGAATQTKPSRHLP